METHRKRRMTMEDHKSVIKKLLNCVRRACTLPFKEFPGFCGEEIYISIIVSQRNVYRISLLVDSDNVFHPSLCTLLVNLD